MKQAISFKDVKLTSNKNPTKDDEVFLNSLHKYETRLQIVKLGYDHHSHIVKTVDFPMTHFVAITKCNYYNFYLRDLKLNKHAKSKWERNKQVPQQQGVKHQQVQHHVQNHVQNQVQPVFQNQQPQVAQNTGYYVFPPNPAYHKGHYTGADNREVINANYPGFAPNPYPQEANSVASAFEKRRLHKLNTYRNMQHTHGFNQKFMQGSNSSISIELIYFYFQSKHLSAECRTYPHAKMSKEPNCPYVRMSVGPKSTHAEMSSAKMSVLNASWRNGRCEISSSQFIAEIDFLQFLNESWSKIILRCMQFRDYI